MSFVDRKDAQIWWEAEGSGPPVLLIPGLGSSSDIWYRLLPLLTARYRALRLDNRGTGRTGVPPGPYPVELMADDAAAVLDAAGETSAHVIGASLGGLIAQELTLARPDKVRSLVLACTNPGGPEAVHTEDRQQLVSGGEPPPPEVMIPLAYAPATPRERIDEDIKMRMRHPTTPEGRQNQVAGILAYAGSYRRLGQIDVPTLIIHGTADRLADPRNAQVLARGIPHARLELLEGAGHILITDEPQRSAELILGFLDQASDINPHAVGHT
jgi:3-oxoadipate enol-lactonase